MNAKCQGELINSASVEEGKVRETSQRFKHLNRELKMRK